MIQTLTPAQRRAWPLLALLLDAYREPGEGEDFVDMRPKKEAASKGASPTTPEEQTAKRKVGQ